MVTRKQALARLEADRKDYSKKYRLAAMDTGHAVAPYRVGERDEWGWVCLCGEGSKRPQSMAQVEAPMRLHLKLASEFATGPRTVLASTSKRHTNWVRYVMGKPMEYDLTVYGNGRVRIHAYRHTYDGYEVVR